VEKRWRRHLGPPAVTIGILALAATSSLPVAGGALPLPRCDMDDTARLAATEAPPPATADGAAWYRLEPGLDDTGALAGQHLTLGVGGTAAWTVDLPPESFASGPYGRLVLTGADDGSATDLRLVDVATGCSRRVATEPEVIRRAVLDPTGAWIHEHRVDRVARADLGVWRRSVSGGPATLVLDPAPDDPAIGDTWATPMFWSTDGQRLVVASCGALACRARWLEPDGDRGELATAPFGSPVGATATGLVTHESCPALPCPIVEIDFASGARRTIADAGGPAALVAGPAGPRLVHELPDGEHLEVVDLATLVRTTLALAAGDVLLADELGFGIGVAAPDGTAITVAGQPDGAIGATFIPAAIPAGEADR
jgi:hypothetical protein